MCILYTHCYIKHTAYTYAHYTVHPIPHTMNIPYTHYSATYHYITTCTPVMRRLVVPAFMSNTLLCSSRCNLYICTQHKHTYYTIWTQYAILYYKLILQYTTTYINTTVLLLYTLLYSTAIFNI